MNPNKGNIFSSCRAGGGGGRNGGECYNIITKDGSHHQQQYKEGRNGNHNDDANFVGRMETIKTNNLYPK